jgi:hypothetical protein
MIASTSQPTPARVDAFAPWQAALVVWLLLGAAALLLVPSWRGIDPWFGWLPFWLVVAPAIDLAVLRRGWIAACVRGACELAVRRWRARRRQARPLGVRRVRSTRHRPRGRTIAAFQSVMPRRLRSMRRRNSPMMRR